MKGTIALLFAIVLLMTSCAGGGTSEVSSETLVSYSPDDSSEPEYTPFPYKSPEAFAEMIKEAFEKGDYEFLNEKYGRWYDVDYNGMKFLDYTGMKFSKIDYIADRNGVTMEYTVSDPGNSKLEQGHKYIIRYYCNYGNPEEGYPEPDVSSIFKDSVKDILIEDFWDLRIFQTYTELQPFTEDNYNELDTEQFHNFLASAGRAYYDEIELINKAAKRITGIDNYFTVKDGEMVDIYGNKYCGTATDAVKYSGACFYDSRELEDGKIELTFVEPRRLGLLWGNFYIYRLQLNDDGTYRILSCTMKENAE